MINNLYEKCKNGLIDLKETCSIVLEIISLKSKGFYKDYQDAFNAAMCIIISMYANSFCDAIKFSSAMSSKYWDLVWHVVKYGLDRLSLYIAGILSFMILFEYYEEWKKDWRYALFHYPMRFKILMSGVMISFIVWWINYEWWRNFFDGM